MIVRQFFGEDTCTYTYLLASGISREGIIIDPVDTNIELYNQYFKELDLKLVASIDTHVHADHVTASGLLREATGCNTILREQTKAQCVSLKVKDGEVLNFDGINLKCIYTPGIQMIHILLWLIIKFLQAIRF